MKEYIKFTFIIILILCASLLLLIFPEESADGVCRGLSLCANIIVPSLFPFLFLSVFLVKSGAALKMSRIFNYPMKLLFRQNGASATAVIASLTGGYPAGAKCTAELLEDGLITREDASLLMLFCVSAGPSYLVSTVGAALFNSVNAGYILLAAQMVSYLITGILASRICKKDHNITTGKRYSMKTPYVCRPLPCAVVDAIREASSSMLGICTCIVLFSVVLALTDASGISDFTSAFLYRLIKNEGISHALLPSILEICTAGEYFVSAGIVFTAFATAFGGLCVHIQIFSFMKDIPVRKDMFFLFRLVHALLSAFITQLLLIFFPLSESAVSGGDSQLALYRETPHGAAALIVLCLVTILFIPKTGVDFSERA